MVRISDILKKERDRDRDEEKKKENTKPSPDTSGASIPQVQEVKIKPIIEKLAPQKEQGGGKDNNEKPPETQKKQEIKISTAVINETRKASKDECLRIYEEALTCAQGIFKDDIDYNLIDIKKITSQMEKLVIQLGLDNENILMLALTEDSLKTNYLFCHSVNTCIYGVQIGIGMGFSRNDLIDLGISALFHDAGMMRYIKTASQPRQLTNEEYKEIQNHTLIGLELMQGMKGLPDSATHSASEHHERIDGSGYPNGLKGKSINEYAKIIGLVDVFTAITHDRPYRKKKSPLDAIKEILNVKDVFEYDLIRLLIKRIGIYPVGSFVQLNTNEIAQVTKLNYEVPLRPVVNILSDERDKAIKEPKILDLSTQPAIFIKSAKIGLSA